MTELTHAQFASPLSLLEEWVASGAVLRDVLITGFTVDLAFIERVVLPLARPTARVTVLTDPAHALHEAVDVKSAGRAFQAAFAVAPRAFHPKVAVLVGDDDVWIAIGSGNPTLAGWASNHELWWVLRGGRAEGPGAQQQVSEWLAQLPDHVAMPNWIAETVRDIASAVGPQAVNQSHSDVQVLHNLTTPIVDQLPVVQAADLRLCAPFFDPSGEAVRVLLHRFGTPRLQLALQPALASLDGKRLVAAVGTAKASYIAVSDGRTLHGKLVEWKLRRGQMTALTGSANITGPALLRSTGQDGNCELAVLSPVSSSLFPEGVAVSAATVASCAPPARAVEPEVLPVHLLGCRLTRRGLLLSYLAARPIDLDVEMSPDGAPESWQARGRIAAAEVVTGVVREAAVVSDELSGRVVRLAWGPPAARRASAEVFITDVERCAPRAEGSDSPRLRRDFDLDEILGDPEIARRFSLDFQKLLEHSAALRAGRTSAATTGTTGSSTRGTVDRWQRFLDDLHHTLGPSIASRLFPSAIGPAAPPSTGGGWTIAEGGAGDDLTDDESEDDFGDIEEELARRATRVELPLRERYRRWAGAWVAAVRVPSRPNPERVIPGLALRMTVTSLYMHLLAAGVWGVEEEWRGGLADLVVSLAHDDGEPDVPPENRAYLGSLIAICLSLLEVEATLEGGRQQDVLLRRAWDAGHELAAEAELAVVESLVVTSNQADSVVVSVSDVEGLVELAQSALGDPLAEAKDALSAEGVEIYEYAGAWLLEGEFRDTVRMAARGVTMLDEGPGAVVVASNASRATLMIRQQESVLLADSKLKTWRVYSVAAPVSPATRFGGLDGMPPALRTSPLRQPPRETKALCKLLKVTLSDLIDLLEDPGQVA